MGSACVGAEKEISNLVFPVADRVASWAVAVAAAPQTSDITMAESTITLNKGWHLFMDRTYSAPCSITVN